jgi:hypothetical protein
MSDETQNPDQPPVQEPSVLDYVKSLFRFGNGERIRFPAFVEEEKPLAVSGQQLAASREPDVVDGQEKTQTTWQPPVSALEISAPQPAFLNPPNVQTAFPGRALAAFFLALLGQKLFESATSVPLGIAFYIAAFAVLSWTIYRGEWTLAPLNQTSDGVDPLTYRRSWLLFSIILAFAAFVTLGNNLFTVVNVTFWLSAIAFFIYAFWIRQNGASSFRKITDLFQGSGITLNISAWTLLLIGATALVFFFRFYRTESVPPEPFSDQAEKIFDVYDVSQGQTHIFFTRNTGREGFQMYWTWLVAKIFGTGLSFLSLKLGTAILGFLTLPFVYLLGREIGGPRVGLIAFILVGIGYWPNVISRIGLRFPLYPLFAAPTLLYLIRGLRTRNRNDFLLSGLFLGIGLHGYSPMRVVPIVVVAAFVIYWLHLQSQGARKDLPLWLAMLALVALVVFLPLLRYWIEYPDAFNYRAASRMSGVEQPLPGPPAQIFASNAWKGLMMFNFDDGEIWVNSVPHRPALDVISGALFVIGLLLVLIRYIRYRHWLDLFLLVSIPILQLPSTLSLAFPTENPALNRASGAYIPAFILAALALDGLLTSFGRGRLRTVMMVSVAALVLFISTRQNYTLVFDTFYNSFRGGAWNSSDMGKVIKEFEETYGRSDTAWVVPFPYWVDTRLPAVWAGIPNRDMAMWRDNLSGTVELPGPKLFIVKADTENPLGNDQATLDVLESLYPDGQLRMFDSDVTGHDFWIFFVPNP